MARIVFATIGSLGDLHPVLAFALGLQARGHQVEIATSESYREKIRALGFGFHALGPDLLSQGEHIIAEIMDGARGSERLMRERMFPAVRQMHTELVPIVAGADLLIGSELIAAASILAATHGVRWVSYELAPVSLFSLHDPSVLPMPDRSRWLQNFPLFHRLVKRLAKIASHSWWKPIRDFRRELGLPSGGHPLFEGKYSPLLNLALFSPTLQPPQPDWPANTAQTGFLFHDEPGAYPELPARVREFLAADEPPIVFTLGSAAVYIAGDFYVHSARAAQRLGRRALLLLGTNTPPPDLPPSILTWDYLPFAQIFPFAAAIVHQGGVGTTAQSLRAGRPMLVVPFAHDQFDNAARVVRLGVARTLSRHRYRPERVARELGLLLGDVRPAQTAATVGERVRAECGVDLACQAIERVLTARSTATPPAAAAPR
jgi:rhamnosyltransferase subunit B